MSVGQLSLKLEFDDLDTKRSYYRPPSWPPPPDWVVTEDDDGNARSYFRDRKWDYSSWKWKSANLYFTRLGKTSQNLSAANEQTLKVLAVYFTHGPLATRSWGTLVHRHKAMRKIVTLCDEEGILARDLWRFPRVIAKVSLLFNNKRDRRSIILLLDRLLRAKEQLGFVLIDQHGLAQLVAGLSELDDNHEEQTAYIPPRIWKYQNTRLRMCLDDFNAHREKLESVFNFCLDAYAHNYGSLEAALQGENNNNNPFGFSRQRESKTGQIFYGPFEDTARKYGIENLLKKWLGPDQAANLGIRALGMYFSLVRVTGIAYIANFTLQRCEEAATLRTDCLIWDNADKLGRVAVIRGETTKTDPDSDARWPTSPSVQVAVDAMSVIARLRSKCAAAHPKVFCDAYDLENPPLFIGAFEPWSSPPRTVGGVVRVTVLAYRDVVKRYPMLFDPEELRITEEDLRVARMFTPNLSKRNEFSVGKIWPLGYHQLRRTGAINMFASGLLNDTSIQFLMKHLTLFQTHYYGRNFSRLRFSEEFENISVEARYEVLGKQIQDFVSDRYVSPLGERRKDEIVKVYSPLEFKRLVSEGKKGHISFRETLLGGCASTEYCDYGGIESVSKCAGDDGRTPCNHALFNTAKRESAQSELREVKRKISKSQPGSPRRRALEREATALRNYLNATQS
jgi:hypothetical protein